MTIDTSKRGEDLPFGQCTLDVSTGQMKQPSLKKKPETSLESIRIHGRSRLEKQLRGLEEIWMVVYVQNIEFIPKLIELHGIRKLRVILGKTMSLAWKKTHDVELFEKLARWQIDGTLEVRVAINNWDMHEKWMFGWNEEKNHFVEINGSANPTNTGSGATGKQSNRVTRVDIHGDYESEKYFQDLLKEWNWYVQNSEEFLGSLIELLENEGCEKIFHEQVSALASKRPEFEKALDFAREGDTFVITTLSRFGRSLKNILGSSRQ